MVSVASIDARLKHIDQLDVGSMSSQQIKKSNAFMVPKINANYIDGSSCTFLDDIVLGLTSPKKSLPCKYFYDEKGSLLFDEICKLKEYYITRAECALLPGVGKALRGYFSDGLTIVEPGSGAGTKVQILMKELKNVERFFSLEISSSSLNDSVDSIQESFPDLSVTPLCGDFTDAQDLAELSQEIRSSTKRLVFFPGSTIGNFERSSAVAILNNLSVIAGKDGCLLVGVDLLKNRKKLIKAYDDAAGITAAFNKNILHRINAELDGNFDVDSGFEHVAVFNEKHKRVEMYLKSTVAQKVTVSGSEFTFEKDEYIHTENSHKYSPESFSAIAAEAGLELLEFWTDPGSNFGIFLLQVGEG